MEILKSGLILNTFNHAIDKLAGNDVTKPLTMPTGSQNKQYGHHGCYLVEEIVSNTFKKAHSRNFERVDVIN